MYEFTFEGKRYVVPLENLLETSRTVVFSPLTIFDVVEWDENSQPKGLKITNYPNFQSYLERIGKEQFLKEIDAIEANQVIA